MDRQLSPSETAKRLGITVKALRLYEQHGLVKPRRTAAGWRVYGAAELGRLHQVIALKRLGLPLSRIGRLLQGDRLDHVLAIQEEALAREAEKTALALRLVRTARAKLQRAEALSIDDLTTLTLETTMTAKPSKDEMKAIFDPLIAKHYSQEDIEAIRGRPFAQEAVSRQWGELFAELRGLTAKGDPASPEAIDFARRWATLVRAFTQDNPALVQKSRAVWQDALADPKAASALPVDTAMWEFVGKAMEAMKAQGG